MFGNSYLSAQTIQYNMSINKTCTVIVLYFFMYSTKVPATCVSRETGINRINILALLHMSEIIIPITPSSGCGLSTYLTISYYK